MANFNRIIDIKFKTSSRTFEVRTPRRGIKPCIEISGNLTAAGFVPEFEVRLTNFFSDSADPVTEIQVTAGYEGKMSAGISGKVQLSYTESPGPDKVTVIQCAAGSYDTLMTTPISLKLDESSTLRDALDEISSALGFSRAEVDSSIAQRTFPAPVSHDGSCSEALELIRRAFPGTCVVADGRRLRAFLADGKRESVTEHTLKILSQPPQYSGGVVNVTAPWNPMIKPGDYISFPNTFRKETLGAITGDRALVSTVSFSFSTVGDMNEMEITGTIASQLGRKEA